VQAFGTSSIYFGSSTGSGTLDLATDSSVNAVNITTQNLNGGAITIIADRATSGAGVTHNLGTLGINNGTLNITKGTNVTSGTPSVSFGAVTLTNTGGVTVTLNPTTANLSLTSVNLAAAAANNQTLVLGGTAAGNSVTGLISDGTVSYKLGLTKSNTSTWTLSGANTYTGATLVSAGTLAIGSGGTLGNTAVTVGGGTLQLNNTSAISQNTLTVNNAASVVTENTTNALSGTAALTISNGAVTLSSANNFSGATALSGGSLQLQNAGSMASSALTLSGGTLQLRNDTTNTTFTTASTTVTGNTAINVDQSTTGNTGNTLKLGNVATGANTITVTNGDSYNLTLGTVTSSAGPTFTNNMTAGTLTIGALTLTPASAQTATFNGTTGTTSVGAITQNGANALAVTQSGTGTLTLTGTNTYTGATTVNAGKLTINSGASVGTTAINVNGGLITVNGSTGASAVTVAGGAIGGTGTIGGAVSLTTAGGIDLRDGAVGTLNLSSTLAINGAIGANRLTFDLGSTAGTSDKIAVTGAFSMTNSGAGVVALNQIGGAPAIGTSTLITAASGMAAGGTNFSLLTSKAFGETFTLGGTTTTLTVTTAAGTAGPAAAYWAGTTDANWTAAGNWNTDAASNVAAGAAPGYQTNVHFYTTTPAAGNLTTTLNASDFDINSLTFDAAATSPATIGGTNMLTIEAAAVNGITVNTPSSGTPTQTISASVGLAASQTWTVNTGAALAVSGAISDFGGGYSLTKAGAGTLTLSGANTYSGATTISSGTLQIGAGSTTGSLSTSSAITDNGTLIFNRTNTITQGTDFYGGLNGIGGTGSVTQAGSGTLRLLGVNTFTGGVLVNAGTLQIDNGAALGALPGSPTVQLTFGGNSTLQFFNTTAALAVAANRQMQINSGVTATFDTSTATNPVSVAGIVSGSGGSLTKTGAGTLALTAANTYSGVTSINGGTLQISAANNLGDSSATNTIALNTGTLDSTANTYDLGANRAIALNGAGTIQSDAGTITVSGNITNGANLLTVTGAGNTTISGGIGSGTGGVTKTGTGTLRLSGTNSFTGTLSLNGGTLELNTSSFSSSATLAIQNSTNFSAIGQARTWGGKFGGLSNAATTVNFNGTQDLTFSSLSAGTSQFQNGAGAKIINSGSGVLTFAGTDIGISNGNSTTTFELSGGSNWIVVSAAITDGTGQTGNGLVVSGNTGATLSGANTFTGSLQLNYGTLNVATLNNNGVAGVFGNSSNPLLLSGANNGNATLNFTGNIDQSSNKGITFFQAGTSTLALYIQASGTGLMTLSGGITAGTAAAGRTLYIGGDGKGGVISGAISDPSSTAFTVNKYGISTWTFSVANTYTGITTLTAGTLRAGNAQAFGTNSTAAALTLNGGTLDLHTDTSVNAYNATVGGNVTIENDRATAGAGIVTTLGTLSIGAKTLSITTNTADGVTANTPYGVTFGATTLTGNATFDVANNGTGTGTLTLGATGGATFSLTKQNAGTLVLNAANTYTGATTISGGTLQIGAGGTTGSLATSSAITDNGTLIFNRTNTVTQGTDFITSGISGSGSLVQNGSGTLKLNQNNTYTGGTTINAGTIQIDGGSALGAATGTWLTFGGNSTLQFFGSAGLLSTRTIAINSSVTATFDSAGFSPSEAAVISGSGNLTKVGLGTLTLTGANSYTGLTTVSAGELDLNTPGSQSVVGNLTVSGGTAKLLQASQIASGKNLVVSGGTFDIQTFNQSLANVQLASGNINGTTGILTSANAFDMQSGSVSAILAGSSVALNKTTAGTVTLSGTNTYTGLTTVSNGILQVNVDQALGTTAAGTTVSSGAALKLNNVNYATAEALTINGTGVSNGGALVNSGTSTYAGAVTAATNSTINTGGGTITFTGGLAKNGTVLTLTGGGTVNVNTVGISGSSANSDLVVDGTTANLNVANTYNGPTSITNGATLNANAAGALPTATRSAVSIDPSGSSGTSTLALGANQSVASLTGASTSKVTLGANPLTVGTTGGSTTFAGVISGTLGNVTKDGTSTQVFSGNNTYTGTTTVSSGTLLINGNSSAATGAVAVNGGTLGGSGTIGGAVTVNASGFLAPGNSSAGILTVSSLALNSTSTVQFEVNGTATAGTDYDRIVVSGSGALALDGAFTIAFGNISALANTTDINLISYSSSHTGDFTSLVSTGYYGGSGWTHVGETFSMSSGGQTLTFSELTGNLTVVPEPATWALLAFSLTTVMIFRRRRNP